MKIQTQTLESCVEFNDIVETLSSMSFLSSRYSLFGLLNPVNFDLLVTFYVLSLEE